MADKNRSTAKEAPVLEVKLIADHTHGGVAYKAGETIQIKKRQQKKLREWGRIR